jgi:solute carrier family 25 iron transporter 28/37
MFIACVPAHALYFSVYETGKSVFDADGKGMSAVEAMATGAATAVFHDSVMVPFETIKQRRQLGHYDGVYDAASRIFRGEGLAGFYRSFAVTLSMNVPYSMVVVGTNEYLRGFLRNTWLSPDGKVNLQVSMTAGATAGAVAAAATCPLDVIKTRQQTHALLNAVGTGAPMVEQTVGAAAVPLADSSVLGGLEGGMQVARSILATDGLVGFYRGWWLRATIAAPATAISWTAYDGAKKMLDAYL